MKELLIEYKGQDVVIREEDLKNINTPKLEDTMALKLATFMRKHMERLIERNLLKDPHLHNPNIDW